MFSSGISLVCRVLSLINKILKLNVNRAETLITDLKERPDTDSCSFFLCKLFYDRQNTMIFRPPSITPPQKVKLICYICFFFIIYTIYLLCLLL